VVTANLTAAEWDRKTKELKRKKMLQKQQARERGEEIDSDNNDDSEEEEYDEVVVDVEWDVLEGEDSLTGTNSSSLGPFPFHAGGSEFARPTEIG